MVVTRPLVISSWAQDFHLSCHGMVSIIAVGLATCGFRNPMRIEKSRNLGRCPWGGGLPNGIMSASLSTNISNSIMGIRFTCCHCRKLLNIKTAQAGCVGECPHCHGVIAVPGRHWQNARVPQKKTAQPADSGDDRQHMRQAELSGSIRVVSSEMPPKSSLAGARRNDSSRNSSTDIFLLDRPQVPETLGKVDPIAEAPHLVWYFRSRSIGERGPLKARAMQQHLNDGVVTIGCLVWREDWLEWQPAEKVFPSLVALVEEADALTDRQHAARRAASFFHRGWFALYQSRHRMTLLFVALVSLFVLFAVVLALSIF